MDHPAENEPRLSLLPASVIPKSKFNLITTDLLEFGWLELTPNERHWDSLCFC